jgi:hypothetical protein
MVTIPNGVQSTGSQATDIQVSFAVAASAAAGTIIQGNIYYLGIENPAVQLVPIPNNEVWHIFSMVVTGSSVTTEAEVVIKINGYAQNIKPFLNSLIATSNFQPFNMMETVVLPPNTSWSMQLVLADAAPSTAYTQNLKVRLVRAPLA